MPDNLEFLVDITLRGDVQRVAFFGIVTPDGYYRPELLSVHGIENRIGVLPGSVRPQQFALTLDDSARRWSEIKFEGPLIGGQVEVVWGDPSIGHADFDRIAGGKITSWSRGEATMQLKVEDDASAVLDSPFPWRADPTLFPSQPAQEEASLVPVVYGEVDSGTGAVPCVRIANRQWACCLGEGRIDEVLFVTAEGAVTTVSNYTASQADYGGDQMTIITTTSDPAQADLRWNGRGIDETNPAEQWQDLLGKVGVDTDSASFTDAAAAMTDRGINGAIVVTGVRETMRTVAKNVGISFNLETFVSRSGALGCAAVVPDEDPPNPVEIGEGDTVGGSWRMGHPGKFLTGAAVEYAPDFFAENRAYRAAFTLNDSEQLLFQQRPSVETLQFPYQRDSTSANRVAEDRLFFGREQRVLVELDVRPGLLRSLTVGHGAELTHSLGLGSGGFNALTMRAVGVGIDVDRTRLSGKLRLVDTGFFIFPVSRAFDDVLPDWRLPRMRSTVREIPIHRMQRRFTPSVG